MKFFKLLSSLRNSTKATLVACSVFLAFTALILFFLMLFPIRIKERSATLSAPILETVVTTTTRRVVQVQDTGTEPPHTLSTWKASIQTLEGTTDPDEIPWYDKLFSSSETSSTDPDAEQEDDPGTDMPSVPANLSITEMITHPAVQTMTETIPTPVLTEPPETMPYDASLDEPELVNADPVAPEYH